MLESCQQKNPASGCPLDTPSLPFSSGRYSALSLLPAKGATAVLSAQGNMYRSFQSTHPRGVRLKLSTNPVTARTVSIHAPARGATAALSSSSTHCPVSIHAPARGATPTRLSVRTALSVSLHAPARGATPCFAGHNSFAGRFNPRTREGCDLTVPLNGI